MYLSRHAVIPAASLIIPYHQFVMFNRDAEQDGYIVSFLAPSLRPLAGVPGRAFCCLAGVDVGCHNNLGEVARLPAWG